MRHLCPKAFFNQIESKNPHRIRFQKVIADEYFKRSWHCQYVFSGDDEVIVNPVEL